MPQIDTTETVLAPNAVITKLTIDEIITVLAEIRIVTPHTIKTLVAQLTVFHVIHICAVIIIKTPTGIITIFFIGIAKGKITILQVTRVIGIIAIDTILMHNSPSRSLFLQFFQLCYEFFCCHILILIYFLYDTPEGVPLGHSSSSFAHWASVGTSQYIHSQC
jgi:hypothetical protein